MQSAVGIACWIAMSLTLTVQVMYGLNIRRRIAAGYYAVQQRRSTDDVVIAQEAKEDKAKGVINVPADTPILAKIELNTKETADNTARTGRQVDQMEQDNKDAEEKGS
jgi:hypothetical protein